MGSEVDPFTAAFNGVADLNRTKPSEIPVEVNNNIEFVINLKVAHQLGLTILPVVLYQANRIIR